MLKTFYRRDKLNRIQVWMIEVSEAEGGLRTSEGLIDGAISTTSWTICEPKNIGKVNETTPYTQALKEAESRIRMKKEEGWVDKVEDVDRARKWYEPMLAEKWADYGSKIISEDTLIASQCKLDGIRCIATKKGLFTRNGKEIFAVPHIWEEIQSVLEGLDDYTRIDGELYNHELKDDFNQISSIVRKLRPTEEQIELARNVIQYHIYDIDIKNRSFAERYSSLSLLLNNEETSYLKLVDTHFIDSKLSIEDKQATLDNLYYNDYLANGYEGQMIRLSNSLYENRRTKSLLKRKEFIDDEFTIIDIEEGLGNRSGMMGRIKFDGFDANARGTHEYFKELLFNKEEYIGKKATVRYQNLTSDGKPRFPVVISIRDYE